VRRQASHHTLPSSFFCAMMFVRKALKPTQVSKCNRPANVGKVLRRAMPTNLRLPRVEGNRPSVLPLAR
jgi:hypothetical protein